MCFDNKLLERTQTINDKEFLTNDDRNEINKIDQTLTECMLEAEKLSGRSLIPWSPTKKLHYHVYLYWQLQYSVINHPRNIDEGLNQCKTIIHKIISTTKPEFPDDEIYNLDNVSNPKRKW